MAGQQESVAYENLLFNVIINVEKFCRQFRQQNYLVDILVNQNQKDSRQKSDTEYTMKYSRLFT
jgi:dihydroneopterin aldolase